MAASATTAAKRSQSHVGLDTPPEYLWPQVLQIAASSYEIVLHSGHSLAI
jgi:hypothetical protein